MSIDFFVKSGTPSALATLRSDDPSQALPNSRAIRKISTVFAVSCPSMKQDAFKELKLVNWEPDSRDIDDGVDGKRCGIDANGTATQLSYCWIRHMFHRGTVHCLVQARGE